MFEEHREGLLSRQHRMGGGEIIVDTCVGREADLAEGFQLLSKCKGKPWKDAQ